MTEECLVSTHIFMCLLENGGDGAVDKSKRPRVRIHCETEQDT